MQDWAENRELFNIEASKIRREFDLNKNIPLNSLKLNRVMKEAKERLQYHLHPDPYVLNYMVRYLF